MNYQDTLSLNIKVIIAQATNAISRVEKQLSMLQRRANLAVKLSSLGASMNKVGRIIDPITKQFISQEDMLQRMTKQANKASNSMHSMKNNMLGFGLSALFTGMAIERLGESLLKSLVKTYMTATDEQNRFNQELMAVQASFEFLKFSIMDALGQSDLVIAFIEGLINMVNWIAEFVNKHPKLALLIGLFALGAILVGGFLMVIGQATLGLLGLLAGLELMNTKIIALKSSGFVKWLTSLKMASWLALLPYLILLIAIGFLIYQFIKLKEATGSWKNAFKAAGLGVLLILALIGDGILEFVLLPINMAITAINILIAGWNKLAKTKFGQKTGMEQIDPFKQLDTFVLTGKVKDMMDELAYDVAVENALEKEREADKAKGDVIINVNGDVTDANLMDTMKKGIEAYMDEQNQRNNGTTTGG